MTLWTIIPTCEDAMSIYTLVTFAVYTGILLLVGRLAVCRLDRQENEVKAMITSINEMEISIAVMTEAIRNIETDGTETRTAISEINHILLDKLT